MFGLALSALAIPASASIAFVQSASAGPGGVQTASKAFPKNVTAGDLIIVGTFVDPNATVTVSDTQGNSFTQVAVQKVTTDHDATVAVATAKSSGTDTITVSVSSGQKVWAFSVHEYSGVSATVDTSLSAQGKNTSPTSGSITTANSNDLIFAWFTNGSNFGSENFTALNSAYTKRELSGTGTGQCWGFSNCVESADLITGTTQTTNATATISVSDIWSATVIAFKAATTGTAPTYSISGTVSGSAATVTLSGAVSATTSVAAGGDYTFSGLANGNYTVTANQAGCNFSPASTPVNVSGANVTGINFNGTAITYSISGTVSGSAATVTLSGAKSASTSVAAGGTYIFSGLANGAYSVTATQAGYTFSPASTPVTLSGANVTSVNFTGAPITYSISGTVSGSAATVTLSGGKSATTSVVAGGTYTFSGLANGSYTVTATQSGYTFSPASTPVTISGANVSSINFTGAPITYSISGTVSGSAATVTLSGASSATTSAAAGGTYTFSGLANGSYTVTATQTGYTFSPASTPVTISGANVTSVNFTGTLVTYSISGTVSGSAATVTLSGVSSATTSVVAGGTYTFSGLANGSYIVTATQSGYTFSPASTPVTVNGANVAGVNFTGTPITYSISGTVSGSAATVTLSGASSATTSVAAGGTYTFSGLANGSYTATATQSGYTFSPASTPVTISGANVTSVNFTGTPITYSISGTVSGSAATVTLSGAKSATTSVVAGGTYTFSGLANGSYTVTATQSGNTFSPASTPVTVNGANVASVNFTGTPITYSISGTVSGSAATVTLSGASSATTSVVAGGTYAFSGLANGSYTVTATQSGYTFSPASTPVTVNGANVASVNFTGTPITYSISGTVSGSAATVTLSGATSATTTVAAGGTFAFSGLANGSYAVTATQSGYTFSPASTPVTVNGANVASVNFTGTLVTYSISGTVSGSAATVTLSGASSATTTVAAGGTYTFSGLANGSYTVTATQSGYTFSPASTPVTVSSANVTSVNFTGTLITYSISGTVSGSAATVTLSGAVSATTTVAAGGTYTFSGLANGSYTVTATQSGYTFSPASTPVTISAANVTSVNFTGTISSSPQPIAIVQCITSAPGGVQTASKAFSKNVTAGDLIIVGTFVDPGATVTVSDSQGNTFAQVAVQNVTSDHTATVAAASAKSSGADTITVSVGSGQKVWAFSIHEYSGVSATVDKSVTAQGQSTSLASGSLTTTNSNDLVFAWFTNGSNFGGENFTALNSAYTKRELSGTGTGQCWGFSNCVESADLATGTTLTTNATASLSVSDIWSATVIAFKAATNGTAPTYAISGTVSGSAATVTLSGASAATTTVAAGGTYTFSGLANGSYTVTATQSGYTFSPASSSVTVSGANVTGVNFSGTPIVTGGSYSISGTVSGSAATVTLSGASSATTTVAAGGTYTFSGLASGSYTVAATQTGYTFSPASTPVTVSGANVTGVNFTGTPITYSISGTVTGSAAAVTLSGAKSATASVAVGGTYTFSGLANGSYTVTPTQSGYSFSPTFSSVTVGGANVNGVNFSGTATGGAYSISGTVTGSAATLTLSGAASATTTTNANGNYTFSGLANGLYVASASQPGYSFSPTTASVTVSSANVTGVNFTSTALPPSVSLSWTASISPNISGYNVYRATVSGGPYTQVNASLVSGTAYADTSVSSGTTYYYVATAVDSNNNKSGYSNQTTATMP